MINPALLRDEVQDYIIKNIDTDINKLILKGSPFATIDVKELATQIQTKKASQKKLPTWFKHKGIIFPNKLNLEQASSELTAQYKCSLIKPKTSLIDLTGGFGVDGYYFSKIAVQVIHYEKDELLSLIAAHNAKILKVDNIKFYSGDSKTYLSKVSTVDTIYVDPSRRDSSGRVFLLEDCEPNIVADLDLYLKKANYIIIKAAPMLDIDAAVKALKHVAEIHIVSINNECKELIFVINKHAKDIKLTCALLKGDKTTVYTFAYAAEKLMEVKFSPVLKYLYEPDAAFLKAGLFKSLTEKFSIKKLHQHSHLYTTEEIIENFPGRTLKVKSITNFNDFPQINKIKTANVITRNFHLKPEEIRKKFKIKDGGENYLYFSTDHKNNRIVMSCERLK